VVPQQAALYCIEGIGMRQRSCKVRRLLFLKRYCSFQHTAAVFILEQKERGNRQTARETERECVRVWERSTKRTQRPS